MLTNFHCHVCQTKLTFNPAFKLEFALHVGHAFSRFPPKNCQKLNTSLSTIYYPSTCMENIQSMFVFFSQEPFDGEAEVARQL